MTEGAASASSLARDLKIAVLFSTRLPFASISTSTVTGADLARASWALPLAGALVGGIGTVIYWLGYTLGLAPFICATLTVAATLLVTGGLHEDGLADTADGFGGGAARERKLDIMRDSRTGTYGACALVFSILLRIGSLTVLAEPAHVAPALIAAHVAARAILPIFMHVTPPARADGLSAAAGRPELAQAAIAGCIGAATLAFTLPRAAALIAALLLLAGFAGMSRLSMRQVGGQTGDVVGALEQVGECLVLVVASGA